MSFNLNNDFTQQKLQNVLDCSSTKDHSNLNNIYSLPVMTTEYSSNQCYRPTATVRSNYINQPPSPSPSSQQQQQQMNHSSFGMPIIENSFFYPVYNAFAPPPPPPPPSTVNHNRFYPSPTPSFNHHHQLQQHQHQSPQHGMNMSVSPLVNPSNSPSQMYDSLLPNDFYQIHHGRRSSVNTSRSSSPQQQDAIHSRSTSPVNKRYSCRICNKRFTRPSSLTTHIYSHTGEVSDVSSKKMIYASINHFM